MTQDSTIHCDRVRITFAVPSNLKDADLLLRVGAVDGILKGRNHYGFKHPVGNATFFVRPWGPKEEKSATRLTLDGNPAKTGDSYGLYDERPPFEAIQRLCLDACKTLSIPPDAKAKQGILQGDGTVSRIHLTGHFRVGKEHLDEVREAIKLDLKLQKFKTSSERDGGTVYYGRENGRESAYWAVAFYNKYLQLLDRRPRGIPDAEYQRLLELAKGVLRVEVRLNHKVLPRLRLRTLYSWAAVDTTALFFRYLDRLGLRFTVRPDLTAHEMEKLTPGQRRDLLLWLEGKDLRPLMDTRTFQKRVKLFKEELGVNISRRYRPPNDDRVDLESVFQPANLLPASYWQPTISSPPRKGHRNVG